MEWIAELPENPEFRCGELRQSRIQVRIGLACGRSFDPTGHGLTQGAATAAFRASVDVPFLDRVAPIRDPRIT
jgi:hypothetical protein